MVIQQFRNLTKNSESNKTLKVDVDDLLKNNGTQSNLSSDSSKNNPPGIVMLNEGTISAFFTKDNDDNDNESNDD